MQALAAHGPPRKRRRTWVLAIAVVVVVLAGAGIGYAVGHQGGGGSGSAKGPAASVGAQPHGHVDPLTVVATTPAAGTTDVASNATLSVRFSSSLAAGGAKPTLDPPVAGHWRRTGRTTLVFDPSAPLVPTSTEVLTVPGGKSGVQGSTGQYLARSRSVSFTVAAGSTLRLQQLLAQLGYLPLAYVPPTPAPAPRDMAEPQPGALTWRWADVPPSLTTLWVTGEPNVVLKGAIMSFEHQNGLTVDGLAGPEVWTTLLADVAAGQGDTVPYAYVLVTKTLPEHLTVYVDGTVQYPDVPVNTGAPGADTPDGTFEVFEHVVASDMQGTNITGSTYDDKTVPWASYFHTGDALHGFVRAQYGFPQSNGCVEMSIADAGTIWPLTPIGTLVTVVGPPS